MVMLGWAIFDFNPYAYYQVLRLVCFAVFVWQAYIAGDSGRELWAVVLLIAAFVYNPLLPLRLEREQWSVINVATIALLLLWSWSDWRWGNKKT
ncbi:MAG TPA: DUF6804 family protein [Gemmatimonadaceae bacterium]|nr:DUF6804 family protein [Gemmatimonadaceae bacterium]